MVTASDDNVFTYHGKAWHLNLSTKPFTAAGTYTVKVVPGSADYAIVRNDFDPTCVVQFTRQ